MFFLQPADPFIYQTISHVIGHPQHVFDLLSQHHISSEASPVSSNQQADKSCPYGQHHYYGHNTHHEKHLPLSQLWLVSVDAYFSRRQKLKSSLDKDNVCILTKFGDQAVNDLLLPLVTDLLA